MAAGCGHARAIVLACSLSCLVAPVVGRGADFVAPVSAELGEAQQIQCEPEAEEADEAAAAESGLMARWPAAPWHPARTDNSVPVFVMMSLTMVSREGVLSNPLQLRQELTKLKAAGVAGVMSDCWWGITEPEPQKYKFGAYKQFVQMAKQVGLKVQLVTSFHQCGNPEGATDPNGCYIPLPDWIYREENIWFKNAQGSETKAYISLFADDVNISGRTPKEMYRDWIRAFKRELGCGFGTTITEVMLGLGTDGELKYPSYQNGGWDYPGIGMPQAFDEHAKRSLADAARSANRPLAWAQPPGADETGDSNSFPSQTAFYREGGGYTTPPGRFFLEWYSGALLRHAREVLAMARLELGPRVKISGKIAGIHWWYKYPSHAAEANAGYYNTNSVDGYGQIAEAFRASGTLVDFTCLEMTDASQNSAYDCGPQELVAQVQAAARAAGVPFSGENALGFYDAGGYNQMLAWKPPTGYVSSITYLRISDELLKPQNLHTLGEFCSKMGDPGWVTPFSITQRTQRAVIAV